MTLHTDIVAAVATELVALGVAAANRITSGRRWPDKGSTSADARIELEPLEPLDSGLQAVAARTYIVWVREGLDKAGADGAAEAQLELLEPKLAAIAQRFRTGNPLASVAQVKATHASIDAVDREPGAAHIEGAVRLTILVEEGYYAPATGFAAVDSGGGAAALSWTNPSGAVAMVVRRASGATAPATVEDGTGVTLSGALAESVSDSPGAGTWSYAVFAGHDARNLPATTANVYSAPATATVAVTA